MLKRHKALIILLIVFAIGYFGMIIVHEDAHKQIFKSYGIDSKIDILNWDMTATTTAEEPCPNDYCTLAHNLNEVIGYTGEGLYTGLFLVFIIFVALKGKDLFPEDEF